MNSHSQSNFSCHPILCFLHPQHKYESQLEKIYTIKLKGKKPQSQVLPQQSPNKFHTQLSLKGTGADTKMLYIAVPLLYFF